MQDSLKVVGLQELLTGKEAKREYFSWVLLKLKQQEGELKAWYNTGHLSIIIKQLAFIKQPRSQDSSAMPAHNNHGR